MIPWTVACQAPLSMGFSRQEYWRGEPFPFPGDLPNPGIKPGSPALQADSLPSEPPRKPWLLLIHTICFISFYGSYHSNLNGPLGQNRIICAIYPPSACLHNPCMSETSLALASPHPL